MSNRHKKTERNEEMARRVLAGEVLERLADEYGITRQRVRMIVKPMIGEKAWARSREKSRRLERQARAAAYRAGLP